MRKGMNPNRLATVTRKLPPEIPTIAIITHLPTLDGWHKQRLEIVKACLITARKHAGCDAYVTVWDNASCATFRGWLMDEYKPDRAILSDNVGKVNALRRMLMMWDDCIVAYADDDILFYPGWLKSQLAILNTFPPAVVSGVVNRHNMSIHLTATEEWAKANAVITPDPSIPHDWDRQHGMSVGREANNALQVCSKVVPRRVDYRGASALMGSVHCQFTARARDVVDVVEFSNKLMMPELPFDKRVNERGLLHLMTVQRTARHLGNVILDEDRDEIARLTNV
jgi:hypothetical protein